MVAGDPMRFGKWLGAVGPISNLGVRSGSDVRYCTNARTIAGLVLAYTAGPAISQNIDLADLGDRGFGVVGEVDGDRSGLSVSGAGDVNGDGLADFIIGSVANRCYVVFGKADSTSIDLASLGDQGFIIEGDEANDQAGISVSSAGDVNGDGLMDLIVGAPRADTFGVSIFDIIADSGVSYVVFGKADTGLVSLGNLSGQGFRINGAAAGDLSGTSVSGAGDVNADGLADVIVGAPQASDASGPEAGRSYVVFGKTDSATVRLGNLGSRGFRLDGQGSGLNAGRSVSGVGDVNADGLADVIVGAPNGSVSGRSYVVFGRTDTEPVPLPFLTDIDEAFDGFVIRGEQAGDLFGFSVAGAGDANGDGLADLVIGAPGYDSSGGNNIGRTYLVYGKLDQAPVRVANLAGQGFSLGGFGPLDAAGTSVAGAADLDGDGRGQFLFGAPNNDFSSRFDAGLAVVSGDPVSLLIDGDATGSFAGSSVSGVGDVNGDGLADLLVGAQQWGFPGGIGPPENFGPGQTFVVFGNEPLAGNATFEVYLVNGDAPNTPVGVSGDGSHVSHPDSRMWVDFPNGADPTEPVTRVNVTLRRDAGEFADAVAPVFWRVQTSRLGWSDADLTFRYVENELVVPETQLRVFHSSDGNAPFVPLVSVTNPLNNMISVNVDELGFFYLGRIELDELIFADGFES